MALVNISPPWVIFYKEVVNMFKFDPHVHVVFDNDQRLLKLYVDTPRKAAALFKYMPKFKKYGNVIMHIEIIPADSGEFELDDVSIADLFEGNTALSFIKKIEGIFRDCMTYVVFVNKVVQYFSDNLCDAYGNTSTLYEDIARDIFEVEDGVMFCTDLPVEQKSIGTPLGEWP